MAVCKTDVILAALGHASTGSCTKGVHYSHRDSRQVSIWLAAHLAVLTVNIVNAEYWTNIWNTHT